MRERSSRSGGVSDRDRLRRSAGRTDQAADRSGQGVGGGPGARDLLALQRRAGNREVARMAAGAGQGEAGDLVVQRWLFGGDPDPAKQEAKQKKQEEAERKKQDKRDRTARHKANKKAESGERKRLQQERRIGDAKRQELKQQVSGGPDKNDGTGMRELSFRFEAKLKEEQARVADLMGRGLPEEQARDQAYEDIWNGAPPDLRALRPDRETPAEQLQREVVQFRNEYNTEVRSAQANKKSAERGQLLDTRLEKLYEEQEARIAELVAQGRTRAAAEAGAIGEVWGRASDKLVAMRPPIGSVFDVQARQEARDRLHARSVPGPEQRRGAADKAVAGLNKAGELSERAESRMGPSLPTLDVAGDEQFNASKIATSQMTGAPGQTDRAAAVSAQLGQSSDVFGDVGLFFESVFGLLGAVSDLANLVADYKSGERSTFDIHTAARVVNSGVTIVNVKANVVSSVVGTVSDFTGQLADVAAQLVPGLGIATTFTSSCQMALELASVSVRMARGNGGLYDSRARGTNPAKVDALVNPLLKLQSIYAQRVEKVSFDLGTTMLKLAASVAEVASAGGYGVPAAVKGALTLIQMVHGLAHWISQSVLAWQTQQSRSARVGRLEGSAEQLHRNDASMAVDALIVRARKGDQVAVAFLKTYDLTDDQIRHKPGAELHERMMADVGADEDPKTVFQNFADAYRSVAGVFDAIDQKERDVAALRKARNAEDGRKRGEWWEAKMFLKSVFAPGKFERSKHRTEVATGRELHQRPQGPQVSGPELQSGSFANIVSIAKGVVLTRDSDEDTKTRWSKAVAEMTLAELQAAAAAPYHDDEMKAFFANWVQMRLREEAARRKIGDNKAKKPTGARKPAGVGAA